MEDTLLELKNLSVSFFTPRGEVEAVRDLSLSLRPGEVLALVGESGCGKSVLCKTVMGLLPRTARMKSGTISLMGRDITGLSDRALRPLRGKAFSMVFQDPMTALDPTMPAGRQIAEAVLVHEPGIKGAALRARVLELMELTGIDRPEERMGQYPWALSGGLRQRVAYLTEPQLRRRILLFLRDRRETAGSDYFRVPYSRQEMAEVLGVNRSALSRELGRMQREGLLEFYRSSFRLKNV